jgi:ferredoxin
MRVSVDSDSCDSNGLCAEQAPEIFQLDSDDVLQVRAGRLDEASWPAAELAARACPKLAITLTDTD